MEETEEIELLEQGLYVMVNIEAEDEDDQVYRWNTRIPCNKPLLPLRAQWAEAHGVVETAVGFEDYLDQEVDLHRTPMELAWSSKHTVHLRAVPVDDSFAEGAGGDVPSKARATEEPRKQPNGKRQRQACAAQQVLPSLPSPAAPLDVLELTAAAAAEREEERSAVGFGPVKRPKEAPAQAPPPALPPQSRLAARLGARKVEVPAELAAPVSGLASGPAIDLEGEPGSPESGRGDPGSAPSGDAFVMEVGVAASRSSACPAPPSLATATAETAAAPLRKRAKPTVPSAAPALGALPAGDEPVTFEAGNPKKAGTGAYDRYERYKVAKSVKEAIQLGAIKGDVQHDFKKGFMKRC